jgi:hypothetical protein
MPTIIAILRGLLEAFSFWGAFEQKKEASDAVKPYKAEAEALAGPDDAKSASIERLRGLHND